RVAVEPGLADQEFHAAAELLRHAVDLGAQVVESGRVVAHAAADAGRRAILAEAVAQYRAPFAGGDAGLRAGDRGRHDVVARARGAGGLGARRLHRLVVARRAPGLEPCDLLGLDVIRHREDRVLAGGERRLLALDEAVDADHGLLAALDRLEPPRVRFDQLLLEIPGVDRGNRAAHPVDALELLARLALERGDLALDLGGAVEDVAMVQQVGLEGEDLLQPQRPLLVPRPWQAERLVPGGQLYRTGARPFRQRHGQHLDQDAGDVVLRLRLGQPER